MPQEKPIPTDDSSIETPKPPFSRIAAWILSVSLVLFVIILCAAPRAESDLFWQLRTGHDILKQHSVPHFDSYSWTRKGHPWVVHEWLAFVLFWCIYSSGHGFVGLFVLKTIIASAIALIMFRHLCWATGYKLIPVLFLTALTTMAVSIGFEVRPQIFTYLFLTLVTSMLLQMRAGGYAVRKIWWLVPIFIVWANVHSGVISGLFLLAALCVGDFIDGINKEDEAEGQTLKLRAKRLLPVIAACLVAMLITPYGTSEYVDFWSTLQNSSAINSVSEWASPTLHDPAGLNFCFLAGILLAGLLFSRRFVLLGDIIIFVALLHSSLTSYRNIPLFALVGTMIAVPYLKGLQFPRITGSGASSDKDNSICGARPEIPMTIIAAIGMVFIGFVSTNHSYRQNQAGSHSQLAQMAGNSVSLATEPVSGTQFIKEASFPGNWKMYNGYDEGGYLIWALPNRPVSIDSRADLYFGDTFEDYLKVNHQSFDWKNVLAKYPSDFIVASAGSGICKLLMTSPDWALVYASDATFEEPLSALRSENTVIFVKRDPANNAEISRIRKLCPDISTSSFMNDYGYYPAVH